METKIYEFVICCTVDHDESIKESDILNRVIEGIQVNNAKVSDDVIQVKDYQFLGGFKKHRIDDDQKKETNWICETQGVWKSSRD